MGEEIPTLLGQLEDDTGEEVIGQAIDLCLPHTCLDEEPGARHAWLLVRNPERESMMTKKEELLWRGKAYRIV